jgi:hypothetical protein
VEPLVLWFGFAAVALGVAALAVLVSRVRSLGRRLGTFECALRHGDGSGWASGIASFGRDTLDWYRVISFTPRPELSWRRSRIQVLDRVSRIAGGRRTSVIELRCCDDGEEFRLAMSEQAFSGFTSWLEAAPPSAYRR